MYILAAIGRLRGSLDSLKNLALGFRVATSGNTKHPSAVANAGAICIFNLRQSPGSPMTIASIGLAGGRMAEGPAIARGSPATLRGIFA